MKKQLAKLNNGADSVPRGIQRNSVCLSYRANSINSSPEPTACYRQHPLHQQGGEPMQPQVGRLSGPAVTMPLGPL